MSELLIVEPMRIAAIAASRGTGAANLATADPKEVWADTATGAMTITVDLGAVRSVDTVLLGYVRPPAAGARWSIAGGASAQAQDVVQPDTALRVPDVTDDFAVRTHALWHGPTIDLRHLTLTLAQPGGSPPLTAGVLVVGRAFEAKLGREWGSGRRPVDTGTVTELPSGGFAVVEGVRKSGLGWTFGDLDDDETDRLEGIARRLGATRPGVVIEDAAPTAGLASRIHYGLFDRWRPYDRRDRAQTKWEVGIQQWV